MEGQSGAGLVGVEVEECVVLNSDEVMGGRWTAAEVTLDEVVHMVGDEIPCYAHRLGHLERGFECFPVCWRDSVDSKSDTHKNQCGVEIACLRCSDLVYFVLVDIWTICVDIYAESRVLVLVCESPEIVVNTKVWIDQPMERITPHTVYIVLSPKDRTIHPDVSHRLKLHVQQIDVPRMEPLDRPQTRIEADAPRPPSRRFSSLLPC